MTNVYRGIDIAGNQGQSGAIDLVEVADGTLQIRCMPKTQSLKEEAGLDALVTPNAREQILSAAIDQPLGFPAGTLRLLAWPEEVIDIPPYDPRHARYREADLAMRKDLGKKDADCVRPPVVCDNVWRALHLLRRAGADIAAARMGQGAWCETHPRMAVFHLLRHAGAPPALLRHYKQPKVTAGRVWKQCSPCIELLQAASQLPESARTLTSSTFGAFLPDTHRRAELTKVVVDFAAGTKEKSAQTACARYQQAIDRVEQVFAARRACLSHLAKVLPLAWTAEVEAQLFALKESDTFEALLCAVAAYAKARNAARQYPETYSREKESDFALEGVVFVPDYVRLAALRRSVDPGPHVPTMRPARPVPPDRGVADPCHLPRV